MVIAGSIIALVFISVVATLLLKNIYPHAVLLVAGLSMLCISWILGFHLPAVSESTGHQGLDLFRLVKDSFSGTNAGVGLMIMSIGGFVAYSDKIGASEALVRIAMKPLSLLRNYPQITAAAVIPIGQFLFICIPSAAGLSLLLMASVFPILVNLGVSRLTAVSVITACTAFGIGPASAITASAVEIINVPSIEYFLGSQLPAVIPLSILMAVVYYFVNRYFDRKTKDETIPIDNKSDNKEKVPGIYALIPVFPLILLLVFSDFFTFFSKPIRLDTTTAMLISFFMALIFEAFRKRNFKELMKSFSYFWSGMGDIFKTVVTLIIAADIFSQGLIALRFIDGLVLATENAGLGAIGIAIVMTLLIFLSSMLMGSGNAAFFAFAPLVPKISAQFGIKSASMILPMNLAASMGRTVSPVAGVIIASAEIAGVSALQIVRRNLIPLGISLFFMLIINSL